MKIYTGTSGYSYKKWKGNFYPSDLKSTEMLGYYADKLRAVEINNTFYRMPSEKLLLNWNAQVPDGFSFVLKASRRITHQKRLADVDEELAYLLRTANVLGPKLGPMLFQLPPYLKKDIETLRKFLALFPDGWRAAIEFRSSSWLDDAGGPDEEVREALAERQVTVVTADTEDDPPPELVATAPYGYLRLRRESYDDAALATWARKVHDQPWEAAYVFFKHEDEVAGPRLATRFAELAEPGSAR